MKIKYAKIYMKQMVWFRKAWDILNTVFKLWSETVEDSVFYFESYYSTLWKKLYRYSEETQVFFSYISTKSFVVCFLFDCLLVEFFRSSILHYSSDHPKPAVLKKSVV